MILLLISFVAGILTILAPCTLSLLPVIIGSSVNKKEGSDQASGEKSGGIGKALTIVTSLGVSIILFTLVLKWSTIFINIPPSVWSIISGVIIILFGLSTLFPALWEKLPFMAKFNANSNKMLGKGYQKKSFWGNVIIGGSLGPVFSSCSPTYFVILATVLPQSFSLGLVYLTVYAIGLAGSLLVIAYFGQKIVNKVGFLADPHGRFKMALGILFILIGIAIISGFDKKLEIKFAESGIFDVTKIEQKLLQFNDKGVTGGENNSVNTSANTIPAPELVNPSGFINTNGEPITIGEFKNAKVVLLDIWTYSCINCVRTLPYINEWYEKYKDKGLVIIGLHTPEFAFEKVKANVEKAVKQYGVKYPVVLDNNYETWNAYGNQYWPRKYLISREGNIVYDHIGEGSYEETEREIQKALGISEDISKPANVQTVESGKVKSHEAYFGAGRNEYLANGIQQQLGDQELVVPTYSTGDSAGNPNVTENLLYLDGSWKFGIESASTLGKAKIVYKYDAKNVYLVASSENPEGSTVTIKLDGKVYKTLLIKDDKMYTIIEGIDYGKHVLEIEIPGAGLDAFAFTFG